MPEHLSLGDFITQVKDELQNAQTPDRENAFFELKEVNLEVSFTVDSRLTGGGRFVVVEARGELRDTRVQKVNLKFEPIRIQTGVKTEANTGDGPPPDFFPHTQQPLSETSKVLGQVLGGGSRGPLYIIDKEMYDKLNLKKIYKG